MLLLVLGSVQASFAAGPAIFFSDLTDAPISGWEGSQTKGAAVTIWGVNLGETRGNSYVTVGGVNLTNDSDYAEWGATTNPITARGMQRVTFWLNSGMTLGNTTISITTSDGTSSTLPFYTRNTGNIYFISTSGSDSNNGSSVANAWRNPKQAKEVVSSGDIVYFKSGVYDAEDYADTPISFSNSNHNNGAINNSIAFISFPGELAQLGSANNTYAIRHIGTSPGDTLTYWTFSKFIMRSNYMITNWGTRDNTGSDDNIRFIGNDCSTLAGGSSILEFAGQQGGQTNLYIIGNYIHDAGVDNRGSGTPNHSYGIYMGGYGSHKNIYIGFNDICYQANGRGIQIYGHTVYDSIDNLYIYNNSIHDNSQNGCVLGGGDGRDGAYKYTFLKRLYFFNNLIYGNDKGGTNWAGIMVGGVSYGAQGGIYYILNNTFYQNGTGAYQLDGSPEAVTIQNNIHYNNTSFYERDHFDNNISPIVGKNLYYGGATDIPSWEHDYITTDPKLVNVSSNNFSLQDESPIKDAGLSIALFNKDYNGVIRIDNAYSIGAFENYSATTSSSFFINIQSVTIQ